MKNSLVLIILLAFSSVAKSQFSYPIKSGDKLDFDDTMFVDELAQEVLEKSIILPVAKIESANIKKLACYDYIITFQVKLSSYVKMTVLYVVKDGFIVSKCEEYEYKN